MISKKILSLIIPMTLLSSCHGFYISPDDAFNIVNDLKDNTDYRNNYTKYTSISTSIENSYKKEGKVIFDQDKNFYYSYLINDVKADIPSQTTVVEQWFFVEKDKIIEARKENGDIGKAWYKKSDYSAEAFASIIENLENSGISKDMTNALEKEDEIINSLLDSDEQYKDVILKSSSSTSLYVKATAIFEEMSIDYEINIEDELIKSYYENIDVNNSFSSGYDYTKADVIYPNYKEFSEFI